jgi:hypothetical protein
VTAFYSRKLRIRLNVLRGYQIVHVLHIGKTGGTAVQHGLCGHLLTPRYVIDLRYHATTLRDIPRGEKVVFFLRDPIARFLSGFYARQRCDKPRYPSAWTDEEREAFTMFPTANHLALALSSPDEQQRQRARRAMNSISHVRTHYADWFGDRDYFLSRLPDIFFIGFQETLAADFERLRAKLGIPEPLRLPTDDRLAHRNPPDIDKRLEPQAVANLQHWYADDYAFFKLCQELAQQVNTS